jgi:hypothetical protein
LSFEGNNVPNSEASVEGFIAAVFDLKGGASDCGLLLVVDWSAAAPFATALSVNMTV